MFVRFVFGQKLTHKYRCVRWLHYHQNRRPCGKNSWCTTPLQSRKTVSKTFTFNRIWCVFHGLSSLDTSSGMIRLWFQYHTHTAMIRHQLWTFSANLDHRWTSSSSPERCTCDIVFPQNFSKFGTIFAAAGFMDKTLVKAAWHEPNDMPTSSATSIIVIR